MQIVLSQHAKDFVEEKLGTGEFGSAEAVIERALEAWRAEELLATINSDELQQSLIDAARGPFEPYRRGEFVELAERMVADEPAK